MSEMGMGLATRAPGGIDSFIRQPTVTERLLRQREGLESQLKTVNEAIDALGSDPKVQKAIDAISRVGGLY